MTSCRTRVAGGLAAAAVAAGLVLLPGATANAAPVAATSTVAPQSSGDGTATGAVQWMQAHAGSSGWEHYCEKAVENAWGTTGVWPSAISHWQGAINAGKAHQGDRNPPKGAFVYWNTSQYGHVGIADGNGGFYSSSVGGAIGHGGSLSYFVNYLGWSNPQVPA